MGAGDQSFRETAEFGSIAGKQKGILCGGNRMSKGGNYRAGSAGGWGEAGDEREREGQENDVGD